MANLYTTAQTYNNLGVAVTALGANAGHRDVARAGLGKTLAAFDIDFAVNGTNFASTEIGPTGAVKEVLNTIATMATIVGTSALRSDGANAGQVITVLVEGDFGTDTYDGTNSEAFAAHLEDLIQAKTSVGAGSVNLSSATVAAVAGFPMAAV
jgi:hypothetical protein